MYHYKIFQNKEQVMCSENLRDFGGYTNEDVTRRIAIDRVNENRLKNWDIEIYCTSDNGFDSIRKELLSLEEINKRLSI